MGLIEGFGLTLAAGVMMGANLVPLKWMRVWKWENFWLVYSLMSLVVAPFALCFFLLPSLGSVYAAVAPKSLIMPFVYGAVWGIAQLGAGISVHRIGLGLTASILNGICAATGTFIPLSIQHPEMLLRRSGLFVIAGTVVMAGGFLTNLGYCFYRMHRNRTWGNFGGGTRELANPLLGGAMWMGAIAVYTSATTFLGVLGVSIGWALFQILMILTGNVAGMLTGEWRQMETRISRANFAGVALLFLAVVLIGAANYSVQ